MPGGASDAGREADKTQRVSYAPSTGKGVNWEQRSRLPHPTPFVSLPSTTSVSIEPKQEAVGHKRTKKMLRASEHARHHTQALRAHHTLSFTAAPTRYCATTYARHAEVSFTSTAVGLLVARWPRVVAGPPWCSAPSSGRASASSAHNEKGRGVSLHARCSIRNPGSGDPRWGSKRGGKHGPPRRWEATTKARPTAS